MQLRDMILLMTLAAGTFCLPGAYAQRDYSQELNDGRSGSPPQGFVPNSYQPNPASGAFGYAPSYSYNSPSGANQVNGRPPRAGSTKKPQLLGWFARYDQLRHRAQMNPAEKQQADVMLSRKLSMFMPGPEKVAAREILSKLMQRYQQAFASLRALPGLPETSQLQQAYLQYFDTAANLFSDYLRVQDSLLAVDANGQPIAAQLMQRKQALEALEHSCKEMDAQLRATYGVNPYAY